MFRYVLDAEPASAERRESLGLVADMAVELFEKLQALTPPDRRSVLDEYAGGPFDDPDQPRDGRAPLLLAEKLPDDAIAKRSAAALENLKADLAALARLRDNLLVARKRISVPKGRPPKDLRRFAEQKLGEVYDCIAPALPPRRRRLFIRDAMNMLGIRNYPL